MAAAIGRATLAALAALALLATIATIPPRAGAEEIQFREQELACKLTVGYATRLLDMNTDGKLDIAIVDSKRIVWLENPTWKEHVLAAHDDKFDNVCFAPADIDGDGQLDFAVGADWQVNNTASGGTIGWLRRDADPTQPRRTLPIAEEPTTHRMHFADLDQDGRPELVVLPLKGRNTTAPHFRERGVRMLAFSMPAQPASEPWPARVLTDAITVSHNFCATDFNRDGRVDFLIASFEGVSLLEPTKTGPWKLTRLGAGNQETSPNRGASEIQHGKLRQGGEYIATIEPWHGHQVVVYTRPEAARPAEGDWLWKRHVLDEDLLWGHAVACANLDADDDQELIIGVRDDKNNSTRRGLRVYDPVNPDEGRWNRLLVDPGGVAIEDLAAADLNGDGKADVVAVGRQTHNVKIYWNETK